MISISLILVSDFMLQMPLLAIIVHVSTITVLSLGLSGLSVGLGAMMPNFRETDPSKIAVGFGGTLNLVVGLSYLVFVIGLMAGPWHIMAGIHGSPNFGLLGTILTLVGLSVGVILGVIAVVLPLKLGARTLREMEF